MEKINPNIRFLSKYNKNNVKIECECLIDGYEWDTTPYILLKGHGCPICKASHGEKEIEKFLQKHNIKYCVQYRFNDCKDKRYLPFDFYLPDYNMCIEYDGEQHFKPVTFGGCDLRQAE